MHSNVKSLSEQAELLRLVFPESGLSLDYLKWLYLDGPDGQDISSDYHEAGELLGHYTVVPQVWRFAGETRPIALSLNTAVHEKARGKGLFTTLAEQSYTAASAHGIRAIIGVANANSTPGFLKRLGFTLIRPLPVVAGFALPKANAKITSIPISPEFLATHQFETIAASISNVERRSGNLQAWFLEKLRWRLSSPKSRYAIHTYANGTLVTTTAPLRLGMRAVVALKFFPHDEFSPIETKSLLRSATAFHKTPLFVYSGFNDRASVIGAPLPRRILPSPLNLIYRPLDQSMLQSNEINLTAFEFLDFDAY